MAPADLEALLAALRGYGVTKYETPEISIELQPLTAWPTADAQASDGPEDRDFDPAKAYEDAVKNAAEAIAAAAAKRS